ncbi:MAG: AAA family ATPase [Endozoicomonadaceae bacterium]|nr:AAA family ATPase [Endozoicomonadaceae bacterium]
MKIDYLHIRSCFKNLENVCIDFDKERLMTVIVGQNGSGKSNVLEALIAIFRNLDLGEKAPFSYLIRYKLGEGDEEINIEIDADPARGTLAKQYQTIAKFYNSEKTISFSKVKRDKKTGEAPYLPKHLFAYYSGSSDRLEDYFRKHSTTFYRNLLRSEIKLKGEIRPLFYAKPYHSQFVLLAFFLNEKNHKEQNFLKQHLGIEGLDSVHFVMRQPTWIRSKNRTELFWGASGVVRDFLERLLPKTIAPLKITRNEDVSLTGKKISKEYFHLFLPNLEKLREFAQDLEPDIFFKMLESTFLSEMISEVRVRVKVVSSDKPLSFNQLSEGEQQLLTVLGLLKFTGTKDSLFLLDEPDTHLNPSWAVNYLSFLRDFIYPNQKLSHLLMVTHHPLAIAELEKDQVQVMKMDENRHVTAEKPMESPRGMGINLILRSDIFGLKTTLDKPTNDDVKKRNYLASKETLTTEEEKELTEINDRLEPLGFTFSDDDPDYMDFLLEKYHSK